MATLNIRIADDIKNQLDALASATGRNKSFLVVEAIRGYLQQEAWQVAEIQKAVLEADAGDFAEVSEIKAVRDKWLKNEG